MSENPFSKPFILDINSSPLKWALVICPHLLSLVVIFAVGVFPPELKIILSITVTLSLYYFLRLHIFRSLKNSVLSIQQDSNQNWFIKASKQDKTPALLLNSSFISNAFIILNYKDMSSNQFSALLTPDSLSKDQFRHLKVRITTN